MWTRRELKDRAKNVLSWNYWKAFLISLVIAVATGGGGGGGGGGRNGSGSSMDSSLSNGSLENTIGVLLIMLAAAFFLIVLALAFRIFLGYPLEVGGRRYFVQSAQNFNNKGCFRFAFHGQNYLGIVGGMLLKGILNFLWYILLIIPGIVKSYSYSMVPYILADNPNIGATKAIRLSNEMTRGHKFRMFVLDLSFIGWFLLGFLCLVVGMFFVLPYVNATKAELYLVLRKNALDSGMCSFDDLALQDPGQESFRY